MKSFENNLILASTSSYRRDLLFRLTPHFKQAAPCVDETPHPGEMPNALAVRLAAAKAQEIARRYPGAVIIGSDQVAELHGQTLGKPGTTANARKQLTLCSGRSVIFHTALCLIDTRNQPHALYQAADKTLVVFRTLTTQHIEHYLIREQPLDCAGSFKSEGLGIALFERIESEDPTALIGLPLIALCRLLRAMGIEPLEF